MVLLTIFLTNNTRKTNHNNVKTQIKNRKLCYLMMRYSHSGYDNDFDLLLQGGDFFFPLAEQTIKLIKNDQSLL